MQKNHSPNTWIVVANGSVAKIFTSHNIKNNVTLIHKLVCDDARLKDSELSSQKPGRSFESVGPIRHTIESRGSPHVKAKLHFAEQLARLINKGQTENQCDRLVVIASPEFLGEIRAHLVQHPHITIDTIDKDFTHLTTDELIHYMALTMQ